MKSFQSTQPDFLDILDDKDNEFVQQNLESELVVSRTGNFKQQPLGNPPKKPSVPLATSPTKVESVSPKPSIIIKPYSATSINASIATIGWGAPSPASAEEDSKLLEKIRPSYVIMYDVDVGFVRRLEVETFFFVLLFYYE